MHQRFYTIAIMVGLLELVGCTSSCNSASRASKAEKKAPKITSFGALSVDKLTPEQLAVFTRLANEENCPCSCPTSFAGCLQANTKCKAAQILGQWVVDRLSEGMPSEYLVPLSKEIGIGYAGSPQMINLSDVHSKGAANPKITVVEFADFDCSHCRTTAPILDAFVQKYPDQVQLIYKYFPRGTMVGKLAAEAVEAAARQGKFWEMHDALFKLELISDEKIVAEAKKIGLKMDVFNKDRNDRSVQMAVQRSIEEARTLGLMFTPTIFFNGRPYFMTMDLTGFEMRLAMELARDESTCN